MHSLVFWILVKVQFGESCIQMSHLHACPYKERILDHGLQIWSFFLTLGFGNIFKQSPHHFQLDALKLFLKSEGLFFRNIANVGLLHNRVQLPVSVKISTTNFQLCQLFVLFLTFTFLGMVGISLLEIGVNNLYLLLDLVQATLKCTILKVIDLFHMYFELVVVLSSYSLSTLSQHDDGAPLCNKVHQYESCLHNFKQELKAENTLVVIFEVFHDVFQVEVLLHILIKETCKLMLLDEIGNLLLFFSLLCLQ